MSTGICGGCKKMTNSATSDWWFTPDFTPTKCYIAWENDVAIPGCAFDRLSVGAQVLYRETIDEWNKNSKKAVKEHTDDLYEWMKKSKKNSKRRRKEFEEE